MKERIAERQTTGGDGSGGRRAPRINVHARIGGQAAWCGRSPEEPFLTSPPAPRPAVVHAWPSSVPVRPQAGTGSKAGPVRKQVRRLALTIHRPRRAALRWKSGTMHVPLPAAGHRRPGVHLQPPPTAIKSCYAAKDVRRRAPKRARPPRKEIKKGKMYTYNIYIYTCTTTHIHILVVQSLGWCRTEINQGLAVTGGEAGLGEQREEAGSRRPHGGRRRVSGEPDGRGDDDRRARHVCACAD
jgi:hypothetical protein